MHWVRWNFLLWQLIVCIFRWLYFFWHHGSTWLIVVILFLLGCLWCLLVGASCKICRLEFLLSFVLSLLKLSLVFGFNVFSHIIIFLLNYRKVLAWILILCLHHHKSLLLLPLLIIRGNLLWAKMHTTWRFILLILSHVFRNVLALSSNSFINNILFAVWLHRKEWWRIRHLSNDSESTLRGNESMCLIVCTHWAFVWGSLSSEGRLLSIDKFLLSRWWLHYFYVLFILYYLLWLIF